MKGIPRPLRILVVDDDRVFNRTLEVRLSKSGFIVESAFEGQVALKLFQQKKFDLVVLDLVMPGMSGFELIPELRKISVDTPIIVLSLLHQEDDIVRTKALGANECFTKASPTFMDDVARYAEKLSVS